MSVGAVGAVGAVKANADSMLFHPPDGPYYERVAASEWFADEPAAEAAGFTRWDRRDRNAGGGRDGRFGPGSADPYPDGSGPPGHDIKGNENSMLFHTPASAFYDVTKAEVWFRTDDDARRAGFRSFTD